MLSIWKKQRLIRRFGEPENASGYIYYPSTDLFVLADVQTTDRRSSTKEDGSDSLKQLKVFSDQELFTDDEHTKQKADLLWFQGKWFTCTSSRLSENTPLRHWTATFEECLDQADAPEVSDK